MNRNISFENIGREYSRGKNTKYNENLLILLDALRKYIIITIFTNLKDEEKKSFYNKDTIQTNYGFIISPGSNNITSDWDISIFLTHDGVEFLSKSYSRVNYV